MVPFIQDKAVRFLLALFVPEYNLVWAIYQFLEARKIAKNYRTLIWLISQWESDKCCHSRVYANTWVLHSHGRLSILSRDK